MNKPKIFLDLDGVIIEMQLALMKLWKAEIQHERDYPPGFLWDIQGAIDHIRVERGLEPANMEPKHFWESIHEQWWLNLPMYHGAKHFISVLETIGSVTLATAHVSPHCAAAKYRWISRYLPKYVRNTFVGDPKHMLAEPNAILIDDRDKNCTDFIAEGGKAILVPRPWNARGYYEGHVFELVLNQLDKINRKVTWT
jgi:5'(3')-deoxyribonucleotidase